MMSVSDTCLCSVVHSARLDGGSCFWCVCLQVIVTAAAAALAEAAAAAAATVYAPVLTFGQGLCVR